MPKRKAAMISEKPWWKSRGMVGGVVTVILLIFSLFDMNTEGLEAPVTEIVILGGALASALIGLRGRYKAQTTIKRGIK